MAAETQAIGVELDTTNGILPENTALDGLKSVLEGTGIDTTVGTAAEPAGVTTRPAFQSGL